MVLDQIYLITLHNEAIQPFAGARVNTKFQFGYVSLDIISSTVMDQGEYTVEVRSASGSAHSSAKLMINPRKEMEPDYTRSEMMQQVEMKQVKQVGSDSTKYSGVRLIVS